jgi:hypothetical protein
MVLTTVEVSENHQASDRWPADRQSWSSTVCGRAPRSLRTLVAARLLPAAGDLHPQDHILNRPLARSLLRELEVQ